MMHVLSPRTGRFRLPPVLAVVCTYVLTGTLCGRGQDFRIRQRCSSRHCCPRRGFVPNLWRMQRILEPKTRTPLRHGPKQFRQDRKPLETTLLHVYAKQIPKSQENSDRPNVHSDEVIKGQVVTSYSEVIKVLVQLDKLSDLAWNERRRQLQAARDVALKANETDDVQTLEEMLGQPKEGLLDFNCVIRKVLKKAKVKVFVGDQVGLSSLDWLQKSAMVVGVSDRQLELAEPKVANVDLALLVFALAKPDPSVELMTRFTVSLTKAGIPFRIILNKSDMVDEVTCKEWEKRISSWGHDVQCVSVKSSQGLGDLRCLLKDKVAVLCGPSGVGKSSIINWMLAGDSASAETGNRLDVQKDVLGKGGRGRARGRNQDGLVKNEKLQSVQAVSSRSGSGKQTTRTVSLLRLPGGGLLADTPGFSKATLQGVKSTDLSTCFPEIQEALHLSPCKFSDCKHLDEPGCSVGSEWERYEQYVNLLQELEEEEEQMVKKGKLRTAGESTEKIKDSSKGRRMEYKFKSKRYRKENRRAVRQKLGDEFL